VWLANDLAHVEPGRTVIVATHIAVEGTRHLREGTGQRPALGSAVTNREALYRLLEPYEAHIITGHMHESEHLYAHGVHENVVGAVSGAWWSGPICGDGTPNGYAIYEVDGESVRWTYKATGQPLDHQLRAYGLGADPRAPTEIVANVWDADPEWRIVWYEDGERRGAMARRVGHDPLSMELHAGPELPPTRTWVDPYMTGHLYYAPVSLSARELVVEATDRFGRSYSVRVAPRV
jgi:C terminal of Calcineurin-like phosphoesterase